MYIDECLVHLERKMLVRKDMDLKEHERLSNITLKHKVKYIYRLIHGHFHIVLVIIPRPPYWPETQDLSTAG
jgi:hypothetical protein